MHENRSISRPLRGGAIALSPESKMPLATVPSMDLVMRGAQSILELDLAKKNRRQSMLARRIRPAARDLLLSSTAFPVRAKGALVLQLATLVEAGFTYLGWYCSLQLDSCFGGLTVVLSSTPVNGFPADFSSHSG